MLKYLLLLFCVFSSGLAIAQQPTLSISSIAAEPGQVFTVQVAGADLVGISSMQFSISWDPGVLEYQEVKDFGLPLMNLGNFGQADVALGNLGFLWYNDVGGYNADAVDLFKIEFKALNDVGNASTTVSFSNQPTPIEIADTTFTDIGMIPVNGSVEIMDPNNIAEIENSKTIVSQNVPNPFCDQTFIPIDLKERSKIHLEIIDLTGTQIYEYAEFFNPGLQRINITGDIFPANGTYLYTVLIGDKKVAKKLFYNGK